MAWDSVRRSTMTLLHVACREEGWSDTKQLTFVYRNVNYRWFKCLSEQDNERVQEPQTFAR